MKTRNGKPVNVVKGKKGFQPVSPTAIKVYTPQPLRPLRTPEYFQQYFENSFDSNVDKFQQQHSYENFYRQVGVESHDPSSYIANKVKQNNVNPVQPEPGWITEEEYLNRIRPGEAVKKVYLFERLTILHETIRKAKKRIKIANTLEVVTFGVGSLTIAGVGLFTPVTWWAAGVLVPFLTIGKAVDVFMKTYVKKQDKILNEAESEAKATLNELKNNEKPPLFKINMSGNVPELTSNCELVTPDE